MTDMQDNREKVVDLLVKQGEYFMTHTQRQKALGELAKGVGLRDHLEQQREMVERRVISDGTYLIAVEYACDISPLDMSQVNIQPEALALVPEIFALVYRVLPISLKEGTLTLAIDDLLDESANTELSTKIDKLDIYISRQRLTTKFIEESYLRYR